MSDLKRQCLEKLKTLLREKYLGDPSEKMNNGALEKAEDDSTVSKSTLKKIFGLVPTNEDYFPNTRGLDLLVNLVGHDDWAEFMRINRSSLNGEGATGELVTESGEVDPVMNIAAVTAQSGKGNPESEDSVKETVEIEPSETAKEDLRVVNDLEDTLPRKDKNSAEPEEKLDEEGKSEKKNRKGQLVKPSVFYLGASVCILVFTWIGIAIFGFFSKAQDSQNIFMVMVWVAGLGTLLWFVPFIKRWIRPDREFRLPDTFFRVFSSLLIVPLLLGCIWLFLYTREVLITVNFVDEEGDAITGQYENPIGIIGRMVDSDGNTRSRGVFKDFDKIVELPGEENWIIVRMRIGDWAFTFLDGEEEIAGDFYTLSRGLRMKEDYAKEIIIYR